jgi:hypothetical protein
MPLLPRDAGAPAAAPMVRATSAFQTGGFTDHAMSQSREAVQPVCARGSGGARSRGGAGPVDDDGDCVEERESRKQTLPNPELIEEGDAAWFINAANSSSPFGFPQDGAVLRSLLSGRFL